MMKSFNDIASRYDNLWFFSEDYQDWMIDRIISHLDIKKTDKVFDLGGGTGRVVRRIAEIKSLEKAPTCIEPSQEMLAKAEELSHIRCVRNTAESYVKEEKNLEKVLIKEAIHHFQNRREFWKDLAENSPHSQVLVVTRPRRPGFPLFEEALEKFAAGQPSAAVLTEEAESSGFHVSTFEESWDVSMPEEQWFNLLRSRFISDLFAFSDDEIDRGIKSIKKNLSQSTVTFADKIIFMRASMHA